MTGLLQDLRHALRQFRKSPGFAATAILTLALGVGATTAIFTLIQQVMLRSLPVVLFVGGIQIFPGQYTGISRPGSIPDR